jgi:transposase-like protein
MKRAQQKCRTQWQALVNQQSASGLSIANFCRVHKLSQSSFYKWKSTFRQEPKGFFRVSVKALMAPGIIRCILPNGLRLEWDESVALGSLLPVIKGLS